MAERPDKSHRFRARFRSFQDWVRDHVPPGVRLLLGLVLIIGGILGFLPILGFWMIPLGVAVAALDVMPLLRWLHRRNTPPD